MNRQQFLEKARHYCRAGKARYLHLLAQLGELDTRALHKFATGLEAEGLTWGGYGFDLYDQAAPRANFSQISERNREFLAEYLAVLGDVKSIAQGAKKTYEWHYPDEPKRAPGRPPVEEPRDGNTLLQARFAPEVVEWVRTQGGIKSVVLEAFTKASQ